MENDLNLDKFDALVRSLRTCANPRDCEDCPYWARFGAQGCDRLEADAADAIQNLLEVIDTGKTLLPSTETIPAVDAVEVVRCRECRYFCKGENDSESWEWCDCWKKDCWEDCYCACGKRREDGDA